MLAVSGLATLVFSVGATRPSISKVGAVGPGFSAHDSTKVPHYFGPYSNWANSPQVLADAVVTVAAPSSGPAAEATATVDPKTGGIASIAVTSPGSGYTTAPLVTITAPGVTPTALASATSVISQGVVTSIKVDESGFGFFAPAVSFTGGNPTPGFTAAAVASGGVDNLTLTSAGSGYTAQPIIQFSLPDLPTGRQATGSATMNASGAVTGVDVVDAGSGYTSAPTVTILDGNQVNPTAAHAFATIAIDQVDVTSGGQGYDTPPTVTIRDTQGTADKGASATATVAVRGAVTAINVTAAGAGYLTPGIKKFVDTLAGLGPTNANNLGQYIPVATADTTTYPGADYYEIGVVQYRQQFSSSLPATLLRGYVQLATSKVPGKMVPLTNANLDPNVAAAKIMLNGAQVYGVDSPHYLGPTILATKDRPVRVLFRNLLPTGVGGDLFLPVDTTLMGSGEGPNMIHLDANGVPMDMATDLGTVLDGVRNPACGVDPKPTTCYTENRATLHLHGGITPWISDGTPHQWITPATETTDYPKGVSVSNVPDMPDPGPGAQTFFYTNQQSARLMFYHDHSWGITRLNVYAGEAAPYIITDAMEAKLQAPGGALAGLGSGTPLIIQDKTFVPSTATMAANDPTWNYAKWGGYGNLWQPHVYMPAQNPGSPTGVNAFGRWMYGPWFWPPANDAKYPPITNPYYNASCVPGPSNNNFCEPAQIPSTPNMSVGMEAFQDTPVVNGTAYPTTTVDPKAYRFRILNGADDRSWNLSWYVADPTTGTLSEVALNQSQLEAAQTDPNVSPTPDTTKSPAGPDWIVIGNEAGFLPTPVAVPAHVTTFITDPTRFDVGNVDQHSLLLAAAERADVVVDFSQFRGKTLILYNDAPAAFPARQASYDYYTGGPDLTPVGAPTTLPGYGPNTRTIMQVKVSTATPDVRWDRPNTTNDRMGALMAAFAHHTDGSGVFESSQDPIIVGQAAYNTAYGTSFVESGWCNSPTSPTAKCDGFARIQEQTVPTPPVGVPNAFKFDTLSGNQLSIPFEPKGLHDEMNSASFDEWGRMTANLGVEAPGATPLLQNIVLYPFVNPPTEILDSSSGDMPSSLNVTRISVATDGTQIWKLTHNGVDTHPIHFHLYDVQVLNRVTWDNIIIPPDPTELGWKETVRVSPLEDTIVAVRPIVPSLPFAIPDSYRPLNPMMPIGARGDLTGVNALGYEAGFNNTDTAGNPMATPIINLMTNFDWEYVVHCHMLSHEEMDMMRPVTVYVARRLATAPVLSQPVVNSNGFTWTDGTPVDYGNPRATPANKTWGNSSAEIGYRFERADKSGNTVGAYSTLSNVLANTTSYTDATAVAGKTYLYRVTAYNAAGDSRSNVLTVTYPAVKVTLSGVVSGPAGTTRTGVTVTAYTSAGTNVLSTTTNGSGAYSLSLNTGDYKLFITPNITGYSNQWYKSTGNQSLQANAEVITLTANTTTNILLVGNPSFTLSGTVRLLTSSGTLLTNARVSAYNGATSVSSAITNSSGVYTLTLPAIASPGGYKLYITPATSGYMNQWWGSTTGSGGSNGSPSTIVTPLPANTTVNLIVHN
jgi:FtsP/CotA-like multicopper oxidase with cupredoxin domain